MKRYLEPVVFFVLIVAFLAACFVMGMYLAEVLD